MSVMISDDCFYQLMKNINLIGEAANRIDVNCEEKEQTNEYRMYDDIQKINSSIIEIMDILLMEGRVINESCNAK